MICPIITKNHNYKGKTGCKFRFPFISLLPQKILLFQKASDWLKFIENLPFAADLSEKSEILCGHVAIFGLTKGIEYAILTTL